MQPVNSSALFRSIRRVQTINLFKKSTISSDEIVSLAKAALIKPIDRRSDYDIHTIERMMSQLTFFTNIKKKQGLILFQQVCQNLYYKKVLKDQNVIQVNVPGKTFYVILSGSVSIKLLLPTNDNHPDLIQQKSPQDRLHSELNSNTSLGRSSGFSPQNFKNMNNEKFRQSLNDYEIQEVNVLQVGETFGDISLLEGGSRTTAIVEAREDCEFACMDKNQYQRLLGQIRQQEITEKIEFLKQVSFLHGWFDNELKTLSYHFSSITYQLNQKIFDEGDQNINQLYVVKSGEVILKKSIQKNLTKTIDNQFVGKDNNYRKDIIQKSNVMICKLSLGETFGEDGFLYYNTRQFSAYSTQGNTEVFRINKADLERRLWYQHSRSIFEKAISNKWKWRYDQTNTLFQRAGQSTTGLEDMKINHHIAMMRNLLVPEEVDKSQVNDQIKSTKSSIMTNKRPKMIYNEVASTSSSILFSFMEAKKTFGALQEAKILQDTPKKISSVDEKFVVNNNEQNKSIISLINPHSFRSPTKSSKPPKKRIIPSPSALLSSRSSKSYVGSRVPSLNNVELIKRQKFLSLDTKFDNFQSLIGPFKDDEYDAQFSQVLHSYTIQNSFQNKEATEMVSTKACLIDQYHGFGKDKPLMKAVEIPRYKTQTDNQIRVNLFLKQLKKLRKRLKTFQLIKEGALLCDNKHHVNEDGDIVEKYHEDIDDELLILVKGTLIKSPQFNFITRNDYKYDFKEKKKLSEMDEEIVDLKQQIDQLEIKTSLNIEKISNKQAQNPLKTQNNEKIDDLGLKQEKSKIVKVKPLNMDFVTNNNFVDFSPRSPTKFFLKSMRTPKYQQSTIPLPDTRRSQETIQTLQGSILNLTSRKTSSNVSIMNFEPKTNTNSTKFKRGLKLI